MARWWVSMWLANVLPHGRQARAAGGGRPLDEGGRASGLRRLGPVLLGGLVIAALAVVTLAFISIWRRVGAKP